MLGRDSNKGKIKPPGLHLTKVRGGVVISLPSCAQLAMEVDSCHIQPTVLRCKESAL